MCFSAAASFTVGSVLLIAGLVCLTLIPVRAPPTTMTRKQRVALATVAAIPLIFGLHQISEGMVWLNFENDVAVQCFAFTAYAFWPLYISVAFALVEWTRNETVAAADDNDNTHLHWSNWPHNISVISRRRLQLCHVVVALILDAFVLANMIPREDDDNEVVDVNGRLQYEGWGLKSQAATYAASVAYAYVVVASMYISSLPYSSLFGGLVLGALGLTLILWKYQYPSTWCFFAAILSAVVLLIIWSELQLNRRDRGQPEDNVRQSKANSISNDGPPELSEQPPV